VIDVTVFEYLQTLPQDLFEATLMGLMGVPMDEKQEAAFHEWMNKPASDFFPNTEEVSAMDANTILIEIGKTIKKMNDAEKEELRRALLGYCETCDRINQRLADEQKAVSDG